MLYLKRWPWAKLGLLTILLLLVIDISYWTVKTQFNRHLIVTYLDVGQGNAALIQFPGNKRMLIDGGGFPTDHFDVGRMVVAPFLWCSKINRVDYIVLTHPQADHMNGLRFIASHFRPKEFWYNGDRVENAGFMGLMEIIDEKKVKIRSPHDLKGSMSISGVGIRVLHPLPEGDNEKEKDTSFKLNDNSLVLKFSYRGLSLLFPGDLESQGEAVLVSRAGSLLKSHVLLAPHHASSTSCSRLFLQKVAPRICIISSGSGNRFGFPHKETIQRLKAIGCKTIRIDKVGAVKVSLGPKSIQIRSFLEKNISRIL